LEDLVGPELRPLVRNLSHDMPLVVAPAAKALGESGRPEAVLPLIRTLGNKQRLVRFAVVEALLALGSLSVGPLQKALTKERDPEQRQLMSLILDQLERVAKGFEPVPTSVLLERPPELIEEMCRDLRR
jgi:HEAT repeat protein